MGKKRWEYQGTTYQETREQVLKLAAGLVSIGFKKGDRAGLVSDGRNDWIISELGMLYAGGINVPLSIRLENNELAFRLKHSGSKYVFVSELQEPKIEAIRNELPKLEKVIYIDGKENPGENDIDYQDLIKKGEKYLERTPPRNVKQSGKKFNPMIWPIFPTLQEPLPIRKELCFRI